jgi:Protein of unknown function (DUF2752)
MRRDRTMWMALGVLVLVGAAFVLHQRGPHGVPWMPNCIFHQLTGLHCAGCGMTRAAYATLHGRLGEAFRFNPLGMVLLPVAFTGVAIEILGWVRGRPLPCRMTVGKCGACILAAAIIGFWVLRNIPAWPFTLLAPP